MAPGQTWPKVEHEAKEALRIDPGLAEAHASLASATFSFGWNWSAAEQQFLHTIQLKPSYATSRHWYALFLTFAGRPEEGLAEIAKAQELDPMSLIISTDQGAINYYGRHYERALEQCQKTLSIDPGFVRPYFYVAQAHECLGQPQRAIETLNSVSTKNTLLKAELGHACALAGDRGRAQAILKELTETADHEYVSPCAIAAVHAGLDDKSGALEWLEKAGLVRDSALCRLKVDPRFDSLRQHPRFQGLLRQIGLSP
jgi:tetratricopeptide (TPR) repeat protein